MSRNKNKWLYFFIVFFLFFPLVSFGIGLEERAQNVIEKMSTKDKINQLFIFNIYSKNFDKNFQRSLSKHKPGSYILFKRDISSSKQLFNLTKDLQNYYIAKTGLPVFLMVDQEGGNVTRIKTRPGLPSPLSVSSSGDRRLSFHVANETSKILNLLGINMNLAPVVDLSDPNTFNFIGNRSFGNDPNLVNEFARLNAEAHFKNNIIPTFKHFPGHGGVRQDSHVKLPMKLISKSELFKHDIKPFQYVSKNFPNSAIMVGHLAFPNIDPSGYPTTFSKTMIKNILRKDLKFNGIVMTDDLQMKALKNYGSLSERALKAFNAGVDLMMVTGTLRTQINLVNSFAGYLKQGKVNQKEFDLTLKRIIKSKLRLLDNFQPAEASFTIASKKIKKSIKQIKVHSDKIVENNILKSLKGKRYELAKLIEKNKKISVYTAYNSFYRQLKSEFPEKTLFLKKLSRGRKPNPYTNKSSFNIFYVSGLGTLKVLKRLPNSVKKNTLVINTTHPGAITYSGQYQKVIDINTPYYFAGKLLSKVLTLDNNSQERTLSNEN